MGNFHGLEGVSSANQFYTERNFAENYYCEIFFNTEKNQNDFHFVFFNFLEYWGGTRASRVPLIKDDTLPNTFPVRVYFDV